MLFVAKIFQQKDPMAVAEAVLELSRSKETGLETTSHPLPDNPRLYTPSARPAFRPALLKENKDNPDLAVLTIVDFIG